MPQSTDISLNAAGYMLAPASYHRLQDGFPEGRTERTSLTDFFGGQRRSIQLERDTFASSLAIGPALDGQAVRPWGEQWNTTIPALATTVPNRDKPIPHIIVRDRLYIAIGKNLYQGPITTADTGFSWSLVKTYASDITDICIYSSFGAVLAFGAAADMIFRNLQTGTEVAMLTGERALYVAAYAGYLTWIDARTASRPTILRLGTGSSIDQRLFEHDAIDLLTVGGELVIVTKQALYTFTGRVRKIMVTNPAYTIGGTQPAQIPGEEWSGELTPYFQQGIYTERDDYAFIASYGGKVIAWLANGIQQQTPSGDRAGWKSTGLTGRRCFGGTVAAGFCIVSIESWSGRNEIWAYDGNGWWRLLDQPAKPYGQTGTWCWPTPIGSGGVMRNVVIFHEGTTNVTVLRLVEASTPDTNNFFMPDLPATAEFVSPMIDAGHRDKPKAWRKVGAVFASPDLYGNTSSTDAVTVSLEYSTDAGITWILAAQQTLAGNSLANMNFTLNAPLSGTTSTFIQLRVRWTSVNNWTPFLTGIWAEYEILQSPARRRKWQFTVHAADQTIDRDGTMLTRTGRQLIAELWQAWQSDTVLPFRDIDYDADPTERAVRITGIAEKVEQPADAGEWGDSVITLNLVEV